MWGSESCFCSSFANCLYLLCFLKNMVDKRTCQSISDKNDICLLIVYFVLFFVCLFAFFVWKCAYFRVVSPAPSWTRPSCLLNHDHDHDHAFLGTRTTMMPRRPREALLASCRLNTSFIVVITKLPFHLIPEQGMLIVSVSLRSH